MKLKSKVIISLFETVRLSVSISPKNLFKSLDSIKEYHTVKFEGRHIETLDSVLPLNSGFTLVVTENQLPGVPNIFIILQEI